MVRARERPAERFGLKNVPRKSFLPSQWGRIVCAAAALFCVLTISARAASIVPAPGVGPREIAVGSILDLSGPLATEGTAVKNGLTMAFDEINAKGGVLGRRITLHVEDSGYNPAVARAAATRLLARGVFAVLCSNGTPPVSASMPVILNGGVLHLFPFAPAEDTYVPGQPLEFALALPVASQIRIGLASLLEERGGLKVGVLARDDAYGRAALSGAEQALTQHGARVTATAFYPPGAQDFTDEIDRLRRAGSELVVIGAVAQDAFAALHQAHMLGWYPVFLCPQTCYAPEVATLGGRALSGLYAVATTPIPYPDDAVLHDWVRRYEGRFATVASIEALRAYLDARLFAEALRRSGANPTPRHFAHMLEDMPEWRDPQFGGIGVNYSAADHLGLHTGFLAQIRNGRWVALGR